MTAYPMQGGGGLEPIQADIGREAGYTMDRLSVHHRAGFMIFKSSKCFSPVERSRLQEHDLRQVRATFKFRFYLREKMRPWEIGSEM